MVEGQPLITASSGVRIPPLLPFQGYIMNCLISFLCALTLNTHHINNNSIDANASWYNDRSKRTASGMRATYGVAHKTLPFGTRLHITNPRNGRSVTAIVTDRGPFIRGRSLDVNQNVARSLGFNGTAHLNYSIVH